MGLWEVLGFWVQGVGFRLQVPNTFTLGFGYCNRFVGQVLGKRMIVGFLDKELKSRLAKT